MARVFVEPAGIVFDVEPRENVLAAAMRQDVRWPTVCFGQARCTACALTVLDGFGHLGPVGPVEQGVLRQICGRRKEWNSRDTRLACQLTLTGDVRVHKKGAKTNDEAAAQAAARRR